MAKLEPLPTPPPAVAWRSACDGGAREAPDSAADYELRVGRWSRKVAVLFVRWLGVPPGRAWAEVGCGTGALTDAVLQSAAPRAVYAIDRCEAYVAEARARIRDVRVDFEVGDGCALPLGDAACDVAVAGLVLDTLPEAEKLLLEMKRVTAPAGSVAAYVWDCSGGMEMVRRFWDAAVELRPHDAHLDPAERYPLCRPGPLQQLFWRAGLDDVSMHPIEVPTVFGDFDDFWSSFIGRQGSAHAYLASLPIDARIRIRELLRTRLEAYGCPIAMRARAWAVQGTNPLPPSP